MGIENVAEEILREAEKNAKTIVEEGEAGRKQLLEEARIRIKAKKDAIDKEFSDALQSVRTLENMKAKMAVKERILDGKKSMIDECFETALENMREDALQRLFDAGKRMLEPGAAYVSPDDVEKARKLFHGVAVKERNMKGGIVLESKDGKETVDLSLERLAEITKAVSLRDVSKILFGD